ncbi:SRPBCC family protein [Thalassotalea euphylliae]|uniref:SRPBCC family protein n=2 Tax=Thalassotalea euphylliae TaxID=1655234 RepID=A0A3E0U1S9_9GAMM|nr:SRPBCC family protein [Thalassotalea euphylliae]
MVKVSVQQQVQASRQQVLAELLDHVNLSRFFDAKFSLVRAQQNGAVVGGIGSQRQIKMLGTRFVEEILAADENGVSYKIVGDWPVKNHRGDIVLSETKHGTTVVDYQIVCQAPWFIPSALLQYLLTKDVAKAMQRLAALYN